MATYKNPILFGEHADPSIILDGEDYFLVFSSCFGGSGIMQMWQSNDLVNWKPLYYVLNGIDMDNAWAPELLKYEGKYYIYSFSPLVGTFVTICDDIRKGDWSKPIFIKNIEGIDPGHVVDEKGNRYISMSKNMLYPISKDGTEVIGEPVKLCDVWQIPDDIDAEGLYPEGPKYFKRGEYYYFIVTQGGTMGPPTSHGAVCYRSKEIMGEYEMSPYTPFIHTKSRAEKWWSKGHVTVFKAKDEKYYAIYHAIENGQRYTGRITCLLPIEWDENDWFYIKENDENAIYIENIGEKINIAQQLNYTKGQDGLSALYNGCDKNTYDNIKFTENGIKIKTSSELPSKKSMLTFNHQSHVFDYEVTFKTDEQAAFSVGFWFGDVINCGFFIKDGTVACFKHGKLNVPTTTDTIDGDEATIKMCANRGTISFYYKTPKSNWKKWIHCYDVADYNPNVSSGFGYAMANIQVFGKGSVTITDIKYSQF